MKQDFERLQLQVKKRIDKERSAEELAKLTRDDIIYKANEHNKRADSILQKAQEAKKKAENRNFRIFKESIK